MLVILSPESDLLQVQTPWVLVANRRFVSWQMMCLNPTFLTAGGFRNWIKLSGKEGVLPGTRRQSLPDIPGCDENELSNMNESDLPALCCVSAQLATPSVNSAEETGMVSQEDHLLCRASYDVPPRYYGRFATAAIRSDSLP
mmetsp:Transcript_2770/g.4525  ORF Transcript_2770/g.4525 Transcript_2770/m.4525 type:complete len:142 (-) Transcript_2770:485-910(-)